MIKQNHSSNVTAVTMLVVLLGCGMASAKEKPHNKLDKENLTETSSRSTHHIQRKVKDKKDKLSKARKNYKARGLASWYGFESGNKTAMGTAFKPLGLTAAHRTLPLPTKLRVTNLKNNRSIVVTVNDRGPYHKGRLIDLSLGSARALGMKGVGPVEISTIY